MDFITPYTPDIVSPPPSLPLNNQALETAKVTSSGMAILGEIAFQGADFFTSASRFKALRLATPLLAGIPMILHSLPAWGRATQLKATSQDLFAVAGSLFGLSMIALAITPAKPWLNLITMVGGTVFTALEFAQTVKNEDHTRSAYLILQAAAMGLFFGRPKIPRSQTPSPMPHLPTPYMRFAHAPSYGGGVPPRGYNIPSLRNPDPRILNVQMATPKRGGGGGDDGGGPWDSDKWGFIFPKARREQEAMELYFGRPWDEIKGWSLDDMIRNDPMDTMALSYISFFLTQFRESRDAQVKLNCLAALKVVAGSFERVHPDSSKLLWSHFPQNLRGHDKLDDRMFWLKRENSDLDPPPSFSGQDKPFASSTDPSPPVAEPAPKPRVGPSTKGQKVVSLADFKRAREGSDGD